MTAIEDKTRPTTSQRMHKAHRRMAARIHFFPFWILFSLSLFLFVLLFPTRHPSTTVRWCSNQLLLVFFIPNSRHRAPIVRWYSNRARTFQVRYRSQGRNSVRSRRIVGGACFFERATLGLRLVTNCVGPPSHRRVDKASFWLGSYHCIDLS